MLNEYLWLVFGLLTAIMVATQDATVKKFFSHLSAYEMTLYPSIYSLPFFLVTACYMDIPPLDKTFAVYFAISIPLNAFCFVIYNTAIKISPLSLTIPYLAFTPTFVVATGYVFLGETVNIWGLMGIFTTCAGSYILNIDPNRKGILAPFKAVFRETGSWLMLLAAFLFSFAIVFGKGAIVHSSPVFFSVSFFIAITLFQTVVFYLAGKIRLKTFVNQPIHGLITGSLFFVHVICHGFAISLSKAAYMISVKRLSILLGIIYGGLVFNEKNLVIRFTGALFMLAGAVLIVVQGQ